MDRTMFLLAAASSLAARSGPALAADAASRVTTQGALVDALPRPQTGQWVRLVMGSGVAYQKQYGFGMERSESGERAYVETQIGAPGGSCNPNTMKRVYLREPRFGSLLSQAPVLANVADSGTTLTRWGDVGGGQTQTPDDARLRLLDARYLYDDRPCTVVSRARRVLALPFGRIETTYVAATFAPSSDPARRLTHIELWTSPGIPFGVARYRAFARGRDPFELHAFSHGTHFVPALGMSLDTVRAITPDGTHVETS